MTGRWGLLLASVVVASCRMENGWAAISTALQVLQATFL